MKKIELLIVFELTQNLGRRTHFLVMWLCLIVLITLIGMV